MFKNVRWQKIIELDDKSEKFDRKCVSIDLVICITLRKQNRRRSKIIRNILRINKKNYNYLTKYSIMINQHPTYIKLFLLQLPI